MALADEENSFYHHCHDGTRFDRNGPGRRIGLDRDSAVERLSREAVDLVARIRRTKAAA